MIKVDTFPSLGVAQLVRIKLKKHGATVAEIKLTPDEARDLIRELAVAADEAEVGVLKVNANEPP